MIDVFIIFVILSVLVLIHEWGHYIVAKKTGIQVEEFGFGYPPRFKTLFVRKGTAFSLNFLPFGGFVRLLGDDGETLEGKSSQVQGSGASFSEKSARVRLMVIVAGAMINILFGIVAFAIIYTKIGIPTNLAHPRVDEVVENSPAKKAGIQTNDEVIKLNSESIESTQELISLIGKNRGKTVTLTFTREGKELSKEVYIRTVEETPTGAGSIGISLIELILKQYPFWQMPFRGVVQGLKDSVSFSVLILDSLKGMVVKLATSGQVPKEISGPIGIVASVHKEQTFKQGPLSILNVAAVISLNLGVVNLLPIPALDGGRAFFILIEKFIGKKRRATAEGYANMVGMVFLLGLLVLISIKDVIGVLHK